MSDVGSWLLDIPTRRQTNRQNEEAQMVNLSLKILQGYLRATNREKLAAMLTPDRLSEIGCRKVLELFGRRTNADGTSEEITESDLQELAQVAPQSIGGLLTVALDTLSGESAAAERDAILDSYTRILNMVGGIAVSLQTSLALRGFIHTESCVSYWHLHRKTAGADVFTRSGEHVGLHSSMEVYLLQAEPTEELLATMNEAIRRDPDRRLPLDVFDHKTNDGAARLKSIHELHVITEELDPGREETQRKKPVDPFGILARYDSRRTDYRWDIPVGAPALAAMVESLAIALAVQSAHRRALPDAIETAEGKIRGMHRR